MRDIAFPFDDPAWDDATCAYGNTPVRKMLTGLARNWTAEDADYLFFSALLHQDTVYPATFLALPHVVELAKGAPPEGLLDIALFLGGVALHGRLPRTSGGISLAKGDPWAATGIGQRAALALRASLPDIARLSRTAYREQASAYYASGFAAALDRLALASWLTSNENSGFTCPGCAQDSEWLLFGDDLAIYAGSFSLDDWRDGAPNRASSIAAKAPPRPEAIDVTEQLQPLDKVTSALLKNFGALASCPHCDWHGAIPIPHQIP